MSIIKVVNESIIEVTHYVHSEKGNNSLNLIPEIEDKINGNLTEELKDKLRYLGYEIELKYMINLETEEVVLMSAKET